MRVVADTNILISAFLFGGLPRIFVDLELSGAFGLVTSHALLEELDEKLRGKFAMPEAKAQAFLTLLKRQATVTNPSIVLDAVPGDPDDNRVLECALAGQADFIVSGDKHLLRLGSHAGIVIFTVRQFLQTAGFRAD
jgi:putative PIN family toxin of toxin-antitoxin system